MPPFDMTRTAELDLKNYIKAAFVPHIRIADTAPQSPNPRRKAHRNHLKVRYVPGRHLEAIFRLKRDHYRSKIDSFINANVHNTRSQDAFPDDVSGAYLAAPARSNGFSFGAEQQMRQLGPAATLPKVTQWVEEFVLRTVQRTVHISLPHSEEWRWVAIDDYANSSNYDVGLIRSFQWITPVRDDRTLDYDWAGPSPNYNLPGIALDRTEPSIIVFVQAPWVLSQRDFKNFVHTKSLPQMPRTFVGKERLWAKIYDECTRKRCHWFAVTNYTQWTFGIFSSSFHAAFVSPEVGVPHGSQAPISPIQALYYWVASSMEYPDAYVPDKVMEELPVSLNPVVNDDPTAFDLPFDHSDSEWYSDEDAPDSFHRDPSVLSFQSSTATMTPGILRNVPAHERSKIRLPLTADESMRQPQPPHWMSRGQASSYVETVQHRKSSLATRDWLDHTEMYTPLNFQAPILSAPSFSGRSARLETEGSVISSSAGSMYMGNFGTTRFAVAPQGDNDKRQYNI